MKKGFIPGAVVAMGSSKSGKMVEIRFPHKNDLVPLWKFINLISKEDTFVSISGQKISKKMESDFLQQKIQQTKNGDSVYLTAWIGKQLVGVCDVDRDQGSKGRGMHVGGFGLIIAKKFRGQGIGQFLMHTTLELARERIGGLKIIKLEVFENNPAAQKLYIKMGFKVYGKLPKGLLYKGKFVDDVLMYKKL